MKKVIYLITILVSFMLFSCNDISRFDSDSKISKYEQYSDLFKAQYKSLEETFYNFERSLEPGMEYETVSVDNSADFIRHLEETGYFSDDLLDSINQLNLIIENLDFEVFEEYNTVLDSFSNKIKSVLSDNDYYIFTTYVESAKAATAFYVDNSILGDNNARSAISKLWKKNKRKIINFGISVAGGALLGGAVGAIYSGNIPGAIATGLAVATYCGEQSYNSGNIVIGMEFKI